MNTPFFQRFSHFHWFRRQSQSKPRHSKRRLSLRLRMALLSGAMALVVSFLLVLFINTIALGSFPRIIRLDPTIFARIVQNHTLPGVTILKNGTIDEAKINPLERSLLLELRTISLIGFGLVALVVGAGAYWLAGLTLRPVRRVSEAAQRISASTLDTRLALDGPRDEVKELADTFDRMLERLQQTFEQQGRFVGDVAHELRTPLASLRTNLEVVAGDPQATLDDYRAMAETQERALTRLERLVSGLLLLARSEQPPERGSVALGPLLEELCGELQHAAETRGITLQLCDEQDVVVQGDSLLLAHVFSNLIENGINYNRPGGRVVVTLDQKESQAIVRVADTGIGIDTEKQARIFERFYRLDASRACHRGGAGLGLSLVAAITQQHNGQVQVESAPSAGSIFTVILPIETPVVSTTKTLPLNSDFMPVLLH